eukprot:689667-Amphidinium_carterae.6
MFGKMIGPRPWRRPQKQPQHLTAVVDADFAGDVVHRRSTSGVVTKHGKHTIWCQSSFHTVIALSIGESEFYSLVRGAAQALYCAADLGLQLQPQLDGRCAQSIQVFSDSSAARAFAERQGLGRQKHVHTKFLWLQQKTRSGEIEVCRVPTAQNEADFLTKPLSGTVLRRHVNTLGFEMRLEWSGLHRALESAQA